VSAEVVQQEEASVRQLVGMSKGGVMKVSRVLPLAAGLLLGASQFAFAVEPAVTFTVNDTPGHWFDTGVDIAGTRSLAVIKPGDKVSFTQTKGPKAVESNHTITNLVWPGTNADGPVGPMGLLDPANMKDWDVTLTTPGLYVWVCKLHPYMLGAVIVDDKGTAGLDLGDTKSGSLTMLGTAGGTLTFKDSDDIAARLLRAFFIVTNPGNWKDYRKVGQVYQPIYPAVPVQANSLSATVDLKTYLLGKNYDGKPIEKQHKPAKNGIGEVWVDTAYELTAGKPEQFPGTATVVSATGWDVKRKIALPEQKMNNGHNFWTSHDQKQIYQTEWHGNSLYVINRSNGKLLQEIDFSKLSTPCHDPAHVMTRVDTQQVHVGCNGDDTVAEFDRLDTGLLKFHQLIKVSKDTDTAQAQPHAHWMGFDGKSMITPNSNTGDSTLFDFKEYKIIDKQPTGTLPIATGMMPDSSKSYVSNYLGDTISVMCGPYGSCNPGQIIGEINLLQGYDPVSGSNSAGFVGLDGNTITKGLLGGFSVQTPVSPDGKFVIQGNTLSGTITIIDTKTDKLVRSLACDPGCHGVNFGAKKGGGYYAYVTSKFANRLIVLDYDPNNDGDVNDAVIAGTVVLANDNVPKDDQIVGNKGFGAQGVMAVPNIYNGWVQELPVGYKAQLTRKQRTPIGPLPGRNPHDE
jgi:DNA-binding beta-propeller fold protein YncE